MSNSNPTNFAASVEAKLKNLGRAHKLDYRFVLIRYANERFLYRLSISEHARQFVLKGGNLFVIWQKGFNYRPTVDSDLVCFGNVEPEHLKAMFSELCRMDSDRADGMVFDADSIEISPIREETEYGGTRIILTAYLGRARIPLQFDIGVGDAITPAPELRDYPVLLDGKIPRLKTYPMATTIAEKAEVMVTRGIINSRMKDFYDVWLLSELFDHDFSTLRQAILNTFERRQIPFPATMPEAFTVSFAENATKRVQWEAFCRKSKLRETPENFESVVTRMGDFLSPIFFLPVNAPAQWLAGKGWR